MIWRAISNLSLSPAWESVPEVAGVCSDKTTHRMSPDIVSGMRQSSSKKLLTRFKSYGRSLVNQTQRFAKTPADREINNMAAAIPPPFCYKPWPCFASSRSASECWSASFVGGQVSFLRISLCVNNLSRWSVDILALVLASSISSSG